MLGMLGAVGGSRQTIADNLFKLEMHRVQSSREFVLNQAEFGTSVAVCRQFIHSEASPPPEQFKKLQRDFDTQCEWFKKALIKLKSLNKSDTELLDPTKLFDPVPEGGDRSIYKVFLDSIIVYNTTFSGAQSFEREAKPSELELIIRMLGPVLLAVALALRITKVTAEIRTERSK